jgi:hypothetical protein
MVYVDNMRAPFRGLRLSHMIADTDEELDAMGAKLGLNPAWKQRNHYDVSESMRKAALRFGAQMISVQDGARKVHAQRVAAAQKRKLHSDLNRANAEQPAVGGMPNSLQP